MKTTDTFGVGHEPKTRSVEITVPSGERYLLHENEAEELRRQIITAIWKIRAQRRGDEKRLKRAGGAMC